MAKSDLSKEHLNLGAGGGRNLDLSHESENLVTWVIITKILFNYTIAYFNNLWIYITHFPDDKCFVFQNLGEQSKPIGFNVASLCQCGYKVLYGYKHVRNCQRKMTVVMRRGRLGPGQWVSWSSVCCPSMRTWDEVFRTWVEKPARSTCKARVRMGGGAETGGFCRARCSARLVGQWGPHSARAPVSISLKKQ